MTDIAKGRICTKCNKWKTWEHFHKDRYGMHGQSSRCKECKRQSDAQRHPKQPATLERRKLYTQGLKRCSKCGQIKRPREFCKNAKGSFGRTSTCKECSKIKRQEWHEKNPDYARQWYLDNQDKVKAAQERRKRDRPHYYREWQDKNRDHINAYSRQWRAANLEKCRQYARTWEARNPNKIRVIRNAQRASKMGSEGSFTAEEWQALCEKYGNKCLCCGATDNSLTMDHIIPVSEGGSSNIENIQPLCQSCNSRKGIQIIDYR